MSQNYAHIHEGRESVGASLLGVLSSAGWRVDPEFNSAATRRDWQCAEAARGAGLRASDSGAAACVGGEGAALVSVIARVA